MADRRIPRVLAAVGLMLFMAAFTASAQTTGTVTGTVKDTQGGVLPGASVTLISESRGNRLGTVVTSDIGDYVFPNIDPDTYTIEIALSGFRTLKRAGIKVSPGDRVAVPALAIELGTLDETVVVNANAALIQTRSGERSFAVSRQAVESLPISRTGSFTALMALAPGVTTTANNAQSVVNGLAQQSNLASIDGVSTVDTGGNQILVQLNPDAIAEVKVLTSNYQAEFGRSAGIQITAVTKSGTSRFRGSVYGIQRNSDWDANSWTNIKNGDPKTLVKEKDFGYTFGGPVGKPGGNNRLFFFFSQEWRPRSSGGTISRFRVPTDAERAGDFSQSRDNNGALYPFIRDAVTGLPCGPADARGCFQDGGVLGRIPASRLYGPGLAVLGLYPRANITQNDPAYTSTNSYNYQEADPTIKSHDSQSVLRMDYQASQKLRFTGKYLLQTRTKGVNAVNSQFGSTAGARISGFTDFVHLHPEVPAYSATANYTLNSSTFIEATFGYSGNDFSNMSVNGNRSDYGLGGFPLIYPSAIFLNKDYFSYDRFVEGVEAGTAKWFDPKTGAMNLIPNFSYGSRIATNRQPPNLRQPLIAYVRTNDLNASVTKVWNGHTLKAGLWHQGSLKYQAQSQDPKGTVNFGNDANNPSDSTFGYSNAALGVYTSYQQASVWLEGKYVYDQYDWYLQDNWKVSNRLSLDYGIRFVNQQPQYDSRGYMSNFLPDKYSAGQAPRLYAPANVGGRRVGFDAATGQVVPAVQIGLIVPNSGSLTNGVLASGKGIAETNYVWPAIVYAPRFGFAYDFSGEGNLVLRGGTGMFYDRPNGNSVFQQIQNPPNGGVGQLNYGLLADISTQTALLSPPSLQTFEYDARIPTTVPWNIGLQMALPWSSSLDVTYSGSHSYNQLIGFDINTPAFGAAYLPANQDASLAASATPGATSLPANFYRPYVGYGSITQQTAIGYSNYHSLQTSFNRRYANGVAFGVNYTLGRARALLSGANATGQGGFPRVTLKPDGSIVPAADNDEANYHLGPNDRTHTFKANWVWDLPGIEGGGALKVVGAIVNDWQLSGIMTVASGLPYDIGYSYQGGITNVNLTGSPNYPARVRIAGDAGSGCSGDLTRQFNAAAFAGPQAGSNGLESGVNYMRGCTERNVDLAIQRNIRFGSGRQIQLRLDMFNAFNIVNITNRNAVMNLASLATASAPTNLPYDASGNLIAGRDIPRTAGFGVATAAAPPRTMQLQVRFQF